MVFTGRQILVSDGLGFPPGYPASWISRLDWYALGRPPGLIFVLVHGFWPRAHEDERLYFLFFHSTQFHIIKFKV